MPRSWTCDLLHFCKQFIHQFETDMYEKICFMILQFYDKEAYMIFKYDKSQDEGKVAAMMIMNWSLS